MRPALEVADIFRRHGPAYRAAHDAHLGGEVGFLAILHTWGQALTHHLHIHCLVPGVALSSDGRWLGCRPRFFLPIHVLSRLFRRLFLERLQAAYTAGRLRFSGTLDRLGDADAFAAAIRQLRRENWIVYAKPPFGSPEHVLAYLGRYTHRVAIANSRLVSVDDTGVTFRWRDYRHGNAPKLMELAAHEFIRRFLLHSLPLLWRHSAHHRYAAALAHRAVATMARHVMTIGYRTNIDRGSVAVSAPTDAMMPHVRHVADPPANQKHHPAVRPKMPMGASIASTNAGTSASSLPTWWHRITQVRSPGTSAATLIP